MTDARTVKRLAVAAAVSGAVHAGVIAFGRIEAPAVPADLPPLAVSVVNVPAPQTRAQPPRAPSAAGRVARAPNALVPAAPAAAAPTPPAEAEAVTPVEAVPAPASEPVVVAHAAPTTPAPAEPSLPSFPRSGRITYDVLYGIDGFRVGRTVQTWKIDGARYQVASRSETTGIVDVVRGQHRTYLSRGELTPEGFRPDTFLMSRDRGRGSEEARAKFDWGHATVTLGGPAEQREQALPRGSQDIVSLAYQLALDPPRAGRVRVSVTNGRKLDEHVFEVLPEEAIDTPIGRLRTLPIRQVRKAGDESVDVWLAVEYRHLPVRMRFYGRDGRPTGEQSVTEIRLSDE